MKPPISCDIVSVYNNLAPTPITKATNNGISQCPFATAAFAVTTATPVLVGVTTAVAFPDAVVETTVSLPGAATPVADGNDDIPSVAVAATLASALR